MQLMVQSPSGIPAVMTHCAPPRQSLVLAQVPPTGDLGFAVGAHTCVPGGRRQGQSQGVHGPVTLPAVVTNIVSNEASGTPNLGRTQDSKAPRSLA